MDSNKFGNFIRELRIEKGLSQEELGNKLFVHRTTINKWEKGNVIPLNDTLINISEFFDVSVDELLNGKRNEINEDRSSINHILIDMIKSMKKYKLVLLGMFLMLILMCIMFFIYYFITNYNSVHVYRVYGSNDNINTRDGLVLFSKDRLYFRLGNFYNLKEELIDNNISMISLYIMHSNEKTILIEDSSKELIVELSSSKELLMSALENDDKIYIDVYTDDKIETINLKYYEDFKNNMFMSNDDDSLDDGIETVSMNVNNYDILLKYGFIYENNVYYKKDKNVHYYFYELDNFYKLIIFGSNQYNVLILYTKDNIIHIDTYDKNDKLIDKNEINYCDFKDVVDNFIKEKIKLFSHYFGDFIQCE